MLSQDSTIDKNDSHLGNSHKRKHSSQKQMKSKTHGHVALTANSHAGNEGSSSNLPPRTIGEDGHYYECVVCEIGGDLLCCDTCPNTYHLQCLSPPLDSVPAGNWQCQNCPQVADLSTPLSSLQRSKKKASSDKNPPADALHSLAEAVIEEEQNVLNHNGNAKERGTSSAKAIKVYTRRATKKAVGQGDAKLTTCTGALMNLTPMLTDQTYQAMQNDQNASRPVKSNQNPEEQGNKSLLQATNPVDSAQTPKTNQVDKLWLLRDTMQELMKGQGSMQVNERKESNPAVPPKSGITVKEKFAKLRARQKQKVALRNRSRPAIPGSRIIGHASLRRLDAGTNESVRVRTPENGLKHPVVLDPLPLREIRPSVDDIFSRLNSCKNLSMLRDYRRFRWLQEILAGIGRLPTWQNSSFQDRGSHDISSFILNQTAVPQLGNYFPLASSGSNVASSSKSKNADNRLVWNNSQENRGTMACWLEQELDSLWVGVRKFGEGNWEQMLKDSSLYFSELKTAEDLAQRWKMEKLKILNSAATSDDLISSTDLRLNSIPYSENQLSWNPGKPVMQNLLLGGLINIPKMTMKLEANVDEKKVIKIEDDVSSESTISE